MQTTGNSQINAKIKLNTKHYAFLIKLFQIEMYFELPSLLRIKEKKQDLTRNVLRIIYSKICCTLLQLKNKTIDKRE